MIKYSIFPDDSDFTKDIAEQIKNQNLKDVEVELDAINNKTQYLFVNENEEVIKNIKQNYQEVLTVLFSSTQNTSEFADIVIKKPFKLSVFLDSLKKETLFPKIRRKECICLGEYNLYPIKKEICLSSAEKKIKLTEKEIDIIKYLYQITPEQATKEDLLKEVWKYNAEATTHTVETHIYRLRQKIEKNTGKQLIVTKNNGYKLNI